MVTRSNIFRAGSGDVQEFKIPGQDPSGLTDVKSSAFQTARLEGTFTFAEVEKERVLGFEQGRVEAMKEFDAFRDNLMQPLKQALETVETVLDQLSQFRRELFKESEDDVIQLVRSLARKVTGREVRMDPEILKDLVRRALEVLERERYIQMLVNEADFEFMKSAKADYLDRFKTIEEIKISIDSHVPRGQAVLETDKVSLDVNSEMMVDQMMFELNERENVAKPVSADEETLT